MKWEILRDGQEVANSAARRLLEALEARPALVLGLPTGRTPQAMYAALVNICSVRPRCFADATTFNLDEYVGIPPEHPGSYRSYMQRHLFDHVDLRPERVHVPDGSAGAIARQRPDPQVQRSLAQECRRYEAAITAAGGIDLCFLGIGRNGHIAFNEPGSSFASRTRVVELTEATREDNAAQFPDGEPPRRAITMGIGTILEARRIIVMAAGPAKRDPVTRMVREPPTPQLPASALHLHPAVMVLVDEAAAEETGLGGR